MSDNVNHYLSQTEMSAVDEINLLLAEVKSLLEDVSAALRQYDFLLATEREEAAGPVVVRDDEDESEEADAKNLEKRKQSVGKSNSAKKEALLEKASNSMKNAQRTLHHAKVEVRSLPATESSSTTRPFQQELEDLQTQVKELKAKLAAAKNAEKDNSLEGLARENELVKISAREVTAELDKLAIDSLKTECCMIESVDQIIERGGDRIDDLVIKSEDLMAEAWRFQTNASCTFRGDLAAIRRAKKSKEEERKKAEEHQAAMATPAEKGAAKKDSANAKALADAKRRKESDAKFNTCMATVGWIFDICTVSLSIADVVSDVIVAIHFFQIGQNLWGGLVLAILFNASAVYTVLFQIFFLRGRSHSSQYANYNDLYCGAGHMHWFPQFIILYPFAQFIPTFAFFRETLHRVAREGRTSQEIALELYLQEEEKRSQQSKVAQQETDAIETEVAMVEKLGEKMKDSVQSHGFFYAEAVVEAIPQCIVQILAITYISTNEISPIQIVSLVMCLTAIISKTYILAISCNLKLLAFKMCVISFDIFSMFFIFSSLLASKNSSGALAQNATSVTNTTGGGGSVVHLSTLSHGWFIKTAVVFTIGSLAALAVLVTLVKKEFRCKVQDVFMTLFLFATGCVLSMPVLAAFEAVKFSWLLLLLYFEEPKKAGFSMDLVAASYAFWKGNSSNNGSSSSTKKIAEPMYRRKILGVAPCTERTLRWRHMYKWCAENLMYGKQHGPPGCPPACGTAIIDVHGMKEENTRYNAYLGSQEQPIATVVGAERELEYRLAFGMALPGLPAAEGVFDTEQTLLQSAVAELETLKEKKKCLSKPVEDACSTPHARAEATRLATKREAKINTFVNMLKTKRRHLNDFVSAESPPGFFLEKLLASDSTSEDKIDFWLLKEGLFNANRRSRGGNDGTRGPFAQTLSSYAAAKNRQVRIYGCTPSPCTVTEATAKPKSFFENLPRSALREQLAMEGDGSGAVATKVTVIPDYGDVFSCNLEELPRMESLQVVTKRWKIPKNWEIESSEQFFIPSRIDQSTTSLVELMRCTSLVTAQDVRKCTFSWNNERNYKMMLAMSKEEKKLQRLALQEEGIAVSDDDDDNDGKKRKVVSPAPIAVGGSNNSVATNTAAAGVAGGREDTTNDNFMCPSPSKEHCLVDYEATDSYEDQQYGREQEDRKEALLRRGKHVVEARKQLWINTIYSKKFMWRAVSGTANEGYSSGFDKITFANIKREFQEKEGILQTMIVGAVFFVPVYFCSMLYSIAFPFVEISQRFEEQNFFQLICFAGMCFCFVLGLLLAPEFLRYVEFVILGKPVMAAIHSSRNMKKAYRDMIAAFHLPKQAELLHRIVGPIKECASSSSGSGGGGAGHKQKLIPEDVLRVVCDFMPEGSIALNHYSIEDCKKLNAVEEENEMDEN